MKKSDPYVYYVKKRLKDLQLSGLRRGLQSSTLKQIDYICNFTEVNTIKRKRKRIIISLIIVSILTVVVSSIVHNILTARCLVPLNYLVWEATRPLADCDYCVNITKPIILQNVTRHDFKVRVHHLYKIYLSERKKSVLILIGIHFRNMLTRRNQL